MLSLQNKKGISKSKINKTTSLAQEFCNPYFHTKNNNICVDTNCVQAKTTHNSLNIKIICKIFFFKMIAIFISLYRLLDSLVVECWHRVREVPGSIPSQGPRHTKDVIKMVPVKKGNTGSFSRIKIRK